MGEGSKKNYLRDQKKTIFQGSKKNYSQIKKKLFISYGSDSAGKAWQGSGRAGQGQGKGKGKGKRKRKGKGKGKGKGRGRAGQGQFQVLRESSISSCKLRFLISFGLFVLFRSWFHLIIFKRNKTNKSRNWTWRYNYFFSCSFGSLVFSLSFYKRDCLRVRYGKCFATILASWA